MYMFSTLIVYIEHDHVESLGNNMQVHYTYVCIGLEWMNEIAKPYLSICVYYCVREVKELKVY